MISREKSISGKISGSGQKRTNVPRRSVLPATATGSVGHATCVLLAVHLAVEIDLDEQPLAQRVDDGEARLRAGRPRPCSRRRRTFRRRAAW